jgi:hypothetical protein
MSKGEWLFTLGLVLLAVGGALAQFVMIGLIGCLLLLAAWMCFVMGAAFVGDRKSGTWLNAAGSVLVGAAGLGLAATIFGLTNIPASIAVERMRSLPPQSYATDGLAWTSALAVAATLFAVGLRMTAAFSWWRCVAWALATMATAPVAVLVFDQLAPLWPLTA